MALVPPPFPSTGAPPPGSWTSRRRGADGTSTESAGGGSWTFSGPPDAIVAELARRQHGVVSLEELRAAGLSRDAIRHRVARGQLTRLHSGVYLVGPLTDPLTEPFAAVLACGPTAVLSHRAAAHLHGLTKERLGPIHATVSAGRPRPKGVVVHRSPVAPDERCERDAIPLTTIERTLVDIAGQASRRELERLVEQAVVLRLTSEEALAEAAAEHRRAARLRSVLDTLTSPSLTRSEAESRLLELVRQANLPAPVTNTRIGRWEVDAYWPRQRLVVEVDGYAFHSNRRAFERDRLKDGELLLRGLRVLRITWRQLASEPHAVVATLAAAVSRGSGW